MLNYSMGERIRKLRKLRGMTQTDLSEKMYIPLSTISAYENDVVDIKCSVIVELAEVLDTTLDYFFEKDEKKKDEFMDFHELIRTYKMIKNEKLRRAVIEHMKITSSIDI